MKRFLYHQLITVTVLANVLIPQKAFSNPLFDEGSWRAHSFYTRTSWAGLSSGIGGSEADIKNTRNLALKQSTIPNSDKNLRANTEDKQLSLTDFISNLLRIFSIK
ncbi:MAG: hypothetical protein KME55_36020 [Nostoc indistinguendum CM1-VF10]|jgi:hypothetical protein|nr:hypothetical protein [Nostoc indistinguendum CM1-VF10]